MTARDVYTSPTAKWPVMHKEQREMLHVYLANGVDKPSTVKLRNMLPKFADNLHQIGKKEIKNVGSTTREIPDLKDRKDTLLFLLWAIPEKMLLAILRHTVPIDFFNVPEQILEYKKAPGIYLVTIEIKGRDGRFLNSDEIVRAVGLLKQYGIAAEHLNKFLTNAKQDFPSSLAGKDILLQQHFGIKDFIQSWNKACGTTLPETDQVTPATMFLINEAVSFVEAMDNSEMHVCPNEGLVYHNSRHQGARMSPMKDHTQTTSERISTLIRMLNRRKICDQGHPEYQTYADQTPMYIGCSNDLETDTSKYTATRIPSNINENLQLLLRTLVFMGLDAVLKVRVVVRTWKAEQLPVAEQMVIVLGRTVVWQDGLNSEAGGGTLGHDIRDHLEAAEQNVMLSDWFTLNVAASEAEMMAMAKAVDGGKAVFHSAQRDIESMTISRKRRQELANLTTVFPEAVAGSLSGVADLLEARLTRCKAEMLENLKHVFGRAFSALNGEMSEDDGPPASSL